MLTYSTENYEVQVGETSEKSPAYHITNKDSGVVEYEDFLLPRVIDTMLQMQQKLDEVLVKYNEPQGGGVVNLLIANKKTVN